MKHFYHELFTLTRIEYTAGRIFYENVNLIKMMATLENKGKLFALLKLNAVKKKELKKVHTKRCKFTVKFYSFH